MGNCCLVVRNRLKISVQENFLRFINLLVWFYFVSFSIICTRIVPYFGWSVSFLFMWLQIYVPTNPRGAELLPPGIVVAKTDFYLRRLWGEPNEVCASIFIFSTYMVYLWRPLEFFWYGNNNLLQDLKKKPKYLVTFTVGLEQRNHINGVVKKVLRYRHVF